MVFGKSVQFEALLLFIILFFIQKINKGPLDAPIFSGFIKLWCQKLIKKQQGHLGKHPVCCQLIQKKDKVKRGCLVLRQPLWP
jgi:hypothetical protein